MSSHVPAIGAALNCQQTCHVLPCCDDESSIGASYLDHFEIVEPVLFAKHKKIEQQQTQTTPEPQNPQCLYGQVGEMLSESFGQPDSPYGHRAAKAVSDYITGTLTLEKAVQLQTTPTTSFSDLVDEYYSAPAPGESLLMREHLQPLDFSSVETVDHLPSYLHQSAQDLIMKAYQRYEDLIRKLQTDDFEDFVIAIEEAFSICFSDLPFSPEKEQLIDALTGPDGICTEVDAVKNLSQELTREQEERISQKLYSLMWQGQPLVAFLLSELERTRQRLLFDWSQFAYHARIFSSGEKSTFYSDTDLPEAMRWHAGLGFSTQGQQDLYSALVGSSSPATVLLTGIPGQVRVPISVFRSEKDSFSPPPDAVKILRDDVEKPLDVLFWPRVERVLSGFRGAPPIQQLLPVSRDPENAPPALTLSADERLLPNTNNDYLRVQFENQTEFLGSRFLVELANRRAVFFSPEGQRLLSELGTLFQDMNRFDPYLAPHGLVNSETFKPGLRAQFQGLVDVIIRFLVWERDVSFSGVQKHLSDSYDVLQSMTRSRSPLLGKVIWEVGLKMIRAVLMRHQEGFLNTSALYHNPLDCSEDYDQLLFTLDWLTRQADDDGPILIRLQNAEVEVRDVMKRAERTLALPASYQENINQWYQGEPSSYKRSLGFLEQTERQQGMSSLTDALRSILEQETSTASWANLVQEKFSTPKSLHAGRIYVQAMFDEVDNIENDSELLDALKPEHAETFINRFRWAAFTLDRVTRQTEQREQHLRMPIAEVVQDDVQAWTRLMPHIKREVVSAGEFRFEHQPWPTPTGFVFAAPLDKDFAPDEEAYLTQDEFAACLLGEQDDSAHKLTRFLKEYYRYFCYADFQRDETGVDIKTFRDHDVYNRLLIVLEDISQAASVQMEETTDAAVQQKLRTVRGVADQTRLSLADFLKEQDLPFWLTFADDQFKTFVNITPHSVLSKQPDIRFHSQAQGAVARARNVFQQIALEPWTPLVPYIRTFQVSSNLMETYGSDDWVVPPPTVFGIYEQTVRGLPVPEKTDDIKSTLNTQWRDGTVYLLGRLAEQFNAPFDEASLKRYEEIKQKLLQLRTQDLKILLDFYESGGFLTSAWPVDAEGNLSLSPEALTILSGTHFSPAEILWVSGYARQNLWATEIEKMLGERTGDVVYINSVKQAELDDFIFHLDAERAERLAQEIERTVQPLDEAAAGFSAEWLKDLDKERVAGIFAAVSSYYQDPQTLDVRARRLETRRATSLSSREFTTGEHFYAAVYLARSLAEVTGDRVILEKFDDEALLRLEKRLRAEAVSLDRTKIRDLIDGLDTNDLELFYRNEYGEFSKHYGEDSVQWFNGWPPEKNLPQKFWICLDHALANADAYFNEQGEVDQTALAQEIDSALSEMSGLFEQWNEDMIHDVLLQAEMRFSLLDPETRQETYHERRLLEAIRDVLIGRYNQSIPAEVSAHSLHNPNGQLGIPDLHFADAVIGLEQIFSVPNLKNNLYAEGEAWPSPLLESKLHDVFVGMWCVFLEDTSASPVVVDLEGGQLFYTEKGMAIIRGGQKTLLKETLTDSESDGAGAVDVASMHTAVNQSFLTRAYRQLWAENQELAQKLQLADPAQRSLTFDQIFTSLRELLLHISTQVTPQISTEKMWSDPEAVDFVWRYFPQMKVAALKLKEEHSEFFPEFTPDEFVARIDVLETRLRQRRERLCQ